MAEKAAKAARTDRSVFREYFEAILIASLFLRFTNVFVVQTFYIPSESMEDTLLVGDHLFVNRFIYGPAATDWERKYLPLRPIRRGDIIIFRSKTELGMDIVKRAMGAPGDTIQVADKQLYLNGQPVDDSAYAVHKDAGIFPSCAPTDRLPASVCNRDQFGPVTVPAGNYFCMGDNRDKSYDSRFWGTLPSHLVKGRALFIYWSNGAQQPEGSGLAGLIRTALGFLSNTRWERSFRLIR